MVKTRGALVALFFVRPPHYSLKILAAGSKVASPTPPKPLSSAPPSF